MDRGGVAGAQAGWRLAVVWAALGAGGAFSQAPPATDVYVVTLDGHGDERPVFGEPVNLTDREGYDNQPAFLPDGDLVYASIRDGQADIYRYDFAAGTSRAVTETAESEYSPTPIEGGRALSVVRVEADQRQRLWRVPLAGGESRPILAEAEPVGYHAWGEEGGLLLFVLGEPPTLQWWPPQGEPRVLARDVGRSLHRIPGTPRFSFVHKEGEGWWLKSVDPDSGEVQALIVTRPGREDLTWDPQGRAWMADGGRLYRFCPTCSGGWRRMADFGRWGLTDLSRLAFSADGRRLAFVAARP